MIQDIAGCGMSWVLSHIGLSTSHRFPICAPELPMSDEEGERGGNFPTDETQEENGTYRKSRNSYMHLIHVKDLSALLYYTV